MIQISYKNLGAALFQQCVMKLEHAKTQDSLLCFKLRRLAKSAKEGLQQLQDEAKKDLMAKFAVDGEKADKPAESGKSLELGLPFQAIEGKEEEAKAALDAFGERTFELNLTRKFDPRTLFQISSWSPAELGALEPIVEELPLDET